MVDDDTGKDMYCHLNGLLKMVIEMEDCVVFSLEIKSMRKALNILLKSNILSIKI